MWAAISSIPATAYDSWNRSFRNGSRAGSAPWMKSVQKCPRESRNEEEARGAHRYIPSAMSSFPSRSITSRSTPSAAPEHGGKPVPERVEEPRVHGKELPGRPAVPLRQLREARLLLLRVGQLAVAVDELHAVDVPLEPLRDRRVRLPPPRHRPEGRREPGHEARPPLRRVGLDHLDAGAEEQVLPRLVRPRGASPRRESPARSPSASVIPAPSSSRNASDISRRAQGRSSGISFPPRVTDLPAVDLRRPASGPAPPRRPSRLPSGRGGTTRAW